MCNRLESNMSEFASCSIHEIVNDILRGGNKVLFFIGAGFAIDEDLKYTDRLPLGEDVKFVLLCKYFRQNDYQIIFSDEEKRKRLCELEDKFKKEHGLSDTEYITPELVWKELVEGENIENQLDFLGELFSIKKPIPVTYRLLARLMLEYPDKFYLFTTNFDEKIDEAFYEQRNVRYRDKYVLIAVTEDDFKEFKKLITSHPRNIVRIFKLHGTQSKPHTIISTKVDKLSEEKSLALQSAINNSHIMIFIGYSLRDKDIFKALKEAIAQSTEKNLKKIYWCIKGKIDSEIKGYIKEFLSEARDKKIDVRIVEIESATNFMKYLWHCWCSSRMETKAQLLLDEINFCKEKFKTFVEGVDRPIMDPIWGEISLKDDEDLKSEWENITSLLFCGALQRMKHIKQLSTVFLVHPGATHNRFSHMLGVSYLAKEALKHFKELGWKIDSAYALDFLLASLLHDIGHGPFGHVIECLVDRIQTGQYNHENYTVKYIEEGFLDLKEALDRVHGSTHIIVKFLDKKKLLRDRKMHKYYHLSMLISNEGFDIDRLDFLIRDFHFTSIKVPKSLQEL